MLTSPVVNQLKRSWMLSIIVQNGTSCFSPPLPPPTVLFPSLTVDCLFFVNMCNIYLCAHGHVECLSKVTCCWNDFYILLFFWFLVKSVKSEAQGPLRLTLIFRVVTISSLGKNTVVVTGLISEDWGRWPHHWKRRTGKETLARWWDRQVTDKPPGCWSWLGIENLTAITQTVAVNVGPSLQNNFHLQIKIIWLKCCFV